MSLIFVGCFDKCPEHIQSSPIPFVSCSPSEYRLNNKVKEYLENHGSFYTGNPCVVDCVGAELIIVVSKTGNCATLNKHPQYNKYQADFSNSKIWLKFGEDWIDSLE